MEELDSLKDLQETEFLKRISIFSDLTSEEFEKIFSIIEKKHFNENDVIIEEETEGQALYIVKNGYVKVNKKGEKGEEIFLTVLAPGEHFGEISLLDRHPRSANA